MCFSGTVLITQTFTEPLLMGRPCAGLHAGGENVEVRVFDKGTVGCEKALGLLMNQNRLWNIVKMNSVL